MIEKKKIIRPKFWYSTILNSLLKKNTLSISMEKNLKTIPVPITVIKNPVNFDGILSFI